ncbi:M67 family metallopeptidase [Biomphalaria pfeifferi]|uniref:M67 family metallopeptidase n=1 Tax=Biomphalaria pfeifferi TaxID=112525 RepID=A0AAD8AN31_BIOPF|nr:M67 family metallopeptidase [Biomphalaria pfeifferi]
MIYLTEEHKKAIETHGEATYPNECGGMLIGRFEADGKKIVTETFPLENSSKEDQKNRVLILPKDVMKAERYARSLKLDVVGYYHSHPEDAAVPSQYDLDHALPVWSYIIVSVIAGKAVDVRSWQMEDDRSKFNEEELSVAQV